MSTPPQNPRQPRHGVPAGTPHQQPRPAPGSNLGADLGATITWMWQAFSRNLAAFLVSAIVWLIVALVVFIGFSALAGLTGAGIESMWTGEPSLVLAIPLVFLVVIAALAAEFVVMALLQSGAAKAAGIVHSGARPSVGRALIGSGRVAVTAVLSMLAMFVGVLLCVIPGYIVAVLFFYAVPAAVHGARPIDAFKQSAALARSHLGTTILAFVIALAFGLVLGLFMITIPIAVLLVALFQFALHQRVLGRELPVPERA